MSSDQQTSHRAPQVLGAPTGGRSDADLVGTMIKLAVSGADFVFPINRETPVGPTKTRTIGQASLVTGEGGRMLLRLAAGDPQARPSGEPDGYSIRVPDLFERSASGNPIRMSVMARAADGAPATRVAIAYSTNDLGNSGWRWCRVGPEWRVLQIDFKVPPLQTAKGDFIALLPDAPGTPAVEIAAVTARITATAKPLALATPVPPPAKPKLNRPPIALPQQLVQNAKIVAERQLILHDLPKGKIYAEIGVALGDFTQAILEVCEPSQFHAFDFFRTPQSGTLMGQPVAGVFGGKTHEEFYASRFAERIAAGQMEMHAGDSVATLLALPDQAVDVFYLDASHHYDDVKNDLNLIKHKIKPGGIIVINDYIYFDYLKSVYYGVIQAANEFMVGEGWEMTHFALSPTMYCTIAIRKLGK